MNASTNGVKFAISPAQVRAARGLLDWSQSRLAAVSALPLRTLVRFEAGEGAPRQATLSSLQLALEAAGVEFIEQNGGGPGVRLRGIP
jgi:DNA-binding transcriptional regulator YiaG